MVTVDEVLKARRQVRGVSARQLSLDAGLSDSVVGKVESGNIEPSLRVFAAMAVQLELTGTEIAFLVRLEAHRRDTHTKEGR